MKLGSTPSALECGVFIHSYKPNKSGRLRRLSARQKNRGTRKQPTSFMVMFFCSQRHSIKLIFLSLETPASQEGRPEVSHQKQPCRAAAKSTGAPEKYQKAAGLEEEVMNE